ncbi:hypothetical protein V1387_18440, partial [Allomuricauda taeanensis]|uniref:hypothetical protein n=1 Tax=Flagellimonas taeanensis TaxID=1005926 RepID=UPI002E7BC93C
VVPQVSSSPDGTMSEPPPLARRPQSDDPYKLDGKRIGEVDMEAIQKLNNDFREIKDIGYDGGRLEDQATIFIQFIEAYERNKDLCEDYLRESFDFGDRDLELVVTLARHIRDARVNGNDMVLENNYLLGLMEDSRKEINAAYKQDNDFWRNALVGFEGFKKEDLDEILKRRMFINSKAGRIRELVDMLVRTKEKKVRDIDIFNAVHNLVNTVSASRLLNFNVMLDELMELEALNKNSVQHIDGMTKRYKRALWDKMRFNLKTEHLNMPDNNGLKYGLRKFKVKFVNNIYLYLNTRFDPIFMDKRDRKTLDACKAIMTKEILPRLSPERRVNPFESQKTIRLLDKLSGDSRMDKIDARALNYLKDIFLAVQIEKTQGMMKADLRNFRKEKGGIYTGILRRLNSRPTQEELNKGFAEKESYSHLTTYKLRAGDIKTWKEYLGEVEKQGKTAEICKKFKDAEHFLGTSRTQSILKLLGKASLYDVLDGAPERSNNSKAESKALEKFSRVTNELLDKQLKSGQPASQRTPVQNTKRRASLSR